MRLQYLGDCLGGLARAPAFLDQAGERGVEFFMLDLHGFGDTEAHLGLLGRRAMTGRIGLCMRNQPATQQPGHERCHCQSLNYSDHDTPLTEIDMIRSTVSRLNLNQLYRSEHYVRSSIRRVTWKGHRAAAPQLTTLKSGT